MNQRLTRRHWQACIALCFCSFFCHLPASAQRPRNDGAGVESAWAAAVPARLLRENIDLAEQELDRLRENIAAVDDEISKLLEELSSLQPSPEEVTKENDSGTKELKYRPPLARRTRLQQLFFVCLEDRVLTIDFDALNERRRSVEPTDAFRKRLRDNARAAGPSEIVVTVPTGNFDLKYFYHVIDGREKLDNLCAIAKPGAPGESPVRLRQAQSEFRKALQNADPQSVMIQFLVFHDSFDVLRVSRAVAWDQGFEVGWLPYASGEPLILTGGGGGGGVQL